MVLFSSSGVCKPLTACVHSSHVVFKGPITHVSDYHKHCGCVTSQWADFSVIQHTFSQSHTSQDIGRIINDPGSPTISSHDFSFFQIVKSDSCLHNQTVPASLDFWTLMTFSPGFINKLQPFSKSIKCIWLSSHVCLLLRKGPLTLDWSRGRSADVFFICRCLFASSIPNCPLGPLLSRRCGAARLLCSSWLSPDAQRRCAFFPASSSSSASSSTSSLPSSSFPSSSSSSSATSYSPGRRVRQAVQKPLLPRCPFWEAAPSK